MLNGKIFMNLEKDLDLVVHIGGHKTGSTAIQDTALHHSAELAASGIFYAAQRPYFRHAQHSRLADLVKNGRLKQVSRFFSAAACEARAIGAATVFLSGEELWTLSPRSVARFREIAEREFRSIRVACVIRDERNRIFSNFKHFLRHDPSRSLMQFIRDNRRILHPAREIWASEFNDRLIIINYEEMIENLVPYFFKKVFNCELEHNPISNASFDIFTLFINNIFIKDWKSKDTERVLWDFSKKYNQSLRMPAETIISDDILRIVMKRSIQPSDKEYNLSAEYDPIETCERMIDLFKTLKEIFEDRHRTTIADG